jgi:pimeloyl-[acyl-carrier protein] synthase
VDRYFPSTPESFADPYPGYRRLLQDDPDRSELLGTWVVSRYGDVVSALKDPRLTTTGLMEARMRHIPPGHDALIAEVVEQTSHNVAAQQPPEHGQKRSVLAPRFAKDRVGGDAERIQEIVDELLDRFLDDAAFDVIRDFAGPLPLTVIAEVVGIAEGQEEVVELLGDESIELVGAPQPELAGLEASLRSLHRFEAIFGEAIERHVRSPQADLLADLLAAEQAHRLTRDEVVANAGMVVVAGHETTTKLIGNGLLALLRFPDQWALLHDDPSLIDSAIDELLRYDPVVQTTSRLAREDLEIGGRAIRAGDIVHIAIAAAHRDEAQFLDPDRVDIGRTPNRHLGFGIGTHNCLGANLAKLEVRIALGTLIRRLPLDRISVLNVIWDPNLVFRGPKSLSIRLAD